MHLTIGYGIFAISTPSESDRRIRQKPQFLHLPIVLVTAHTDLETSTGLNIGADGFIYKPINLEELLAKVEIVLRSKRGV